ncbi:DUF72 domain-containing protein [Motilibacter aurantiacus]|uniref:DUF72 domain-containing protein n=1 Tax=Motilibacter aurantiacus TaxID=2714955 RepID=UPI0014098C8F|nr:DUF72 domain-containing protein [Motilibacter aurantiacus]NHC45164.1 DUF72 domain-containing protein [Motilibacter aurantiacus]
MGRILVGTASWTDKTLLASGWYPPDAKTAEARLAYYASQFPLVEVDSTYYTPPSERNSVAWAERTPAGFTFNIKAFSLLTEHPTKVSAIYKELRPQTTKRNVYLKDLEPAVVDEVWARFLAALAPLSDAGKLGPILFQFPQWFPIGSRNREYLLQVKERCAPYRVCVEFRNRTWMSEESREHTLDFLRSYALPYVCVDMPQGHTSSIPPVVAATADLAVVRFHGHSDKWESKDIYERFGYEYAEDELREWAPRVAGLAEQADTVHVLMNNCYRNYAQVNARQLMGLLPAA